MTRVEHLVQINRDIRPKIREGYVVICDRYLWDSIIDLAFLHKKDAGWLLNGLNRFMWKFVPQPAVTFFIDIPPEEALRRKDDIPSFEDVKVRANLYRYLANRQSMVLVDGCDSVAAIQNKVRNTIEGLVNNVG
jgi:dTMP kinase